MKVFIGPYPTDDFERKIEIEIDNYDCWNADSTLAMIIAPVLRRIQKCHSIPYTDPDDVPTGIGNPNEHHCEKRWEWIIATMATYFEQVAEGDPFKPGDDIGIQLFAKYYRGLWT